MRLPDFSVKLPTELLMPCVERLQHLTIRHNHIHTIRTREAMLIHYGGALFAYGTDVNFSEWDFKHYPLIPKKEFLEIIDFVNRDTGG